MIDLLTRGPSNLATDVVLDVSLDVLEADPYPVYEWMREHCPIAYVPATGRVLVTTWALCDEAGSNGEVFGPTQKVFNKVYGDPNVMSLSGLPHRELRNALNPPFRPRTVNSYRETKLRSTAAKYIDAIRDHGRIEGMTELLEPLSQRAIGDVLGFENVDGAMLGRWLAAYGANLVNLDRDPAVSERGGTVRQEVRTYLEQNLLRLADESNESAISHLLRDGVAAGTTRSVDDIMGTVGLMIVGGLQEACLRRR